MLKWTPICTNQVVNGSVDFVDPDTSTTQARFYRAVPESNPPQEAVPGWESWQGSYRIISARLVAHSSEP
jgi:hypothetical protein